MGYQIVEGRFFSREFKSDTAAVVLNETAYQQMGFTDLDHAEILTYNGDKPAPLKVIGVIKDFNFRGLKENVTPMGMFLGSEPNFEMAIRLTPGNTQEQVVTLEKIFKKYAPSAPFEYTFLDQNFDLQFRAEQRMSKIILIFTVLAIGIACLGLFGLAAYTAEQRAKEISIRKVMGASVNQVMVLMSKDFVLLVIIAFVIAAPVAWYFTNRWLESFANRVNIDVSAILISGITAVVIAMATISFQSIKAARENPVKAMRSE
jgi:putative ABC transport system permease protein